MSSQLPSLKPRQIVQLLRAKGFEEKRITGSHHIFRHPETGNIVPVPIHGNRDIKRGTLHNILRQADVSIAELQEWLKR